MTRLTMPPEDPVERLENEARRLLSEWGLVVKRQLSRVRSSASTLATNLVRWGRTRIDAMRATRRYLLDPTSAWSGHDLRAVTAASLLGPRALLAGALLAGAYALSTGGSMRDALAPGAVETLWAFGRVAILVLVIPVSGLPRGRLIAAYAAGLTPYLFGITTSLRLIALAASALITLAGLVGAGLPVNGARRAIGVAFGGQAGVVVFGWLVRAAIAALTA